MGRPRWEGAGNELGRRIYQEMDVQDGKWQVMRWEDEFTTRRWDVQDGKWQVMRWEDEFTTRDETSWELAGNEMGRWIYHRRWDVQDGKWQAMSWEDGFTRRWDVQDGKWQVMRWEDEFTTEDGTSKMCSGR